MDCDEIFVCSDYMLACVNGIQNVGPGRLDSADQFNDDINGRIMCDVLPAGGKYG